MNLKDITYSEAVNRIELVLQQIDEEELDVDQLSESIKEVATLIAYCKEKLTKTEDDVQKILEDIKN